MKLTDKEIESIWNAITSNGCREMEEVRFLQAAREIESKVSDSNIDWDKLRGDFFRECTRCSDHTSLPIIDMHPHNLFEWFKKSISDESKY